MGSMLEMLKESMGEQKKPSEKEGKSGGGSDKGGTFNEYTKRSNGNREQNNSRKLEKSGGISPSQVPEEFRKLIDSYNKN